jgi:hypothetical protein
MQFQWNFTGLICSSSPCAYCTGFPVEWFWPSYGPLIKRCFFLRVTQKLVRTTPHKLLVQFYPNFTGMISTKSSCALSVCLFVCHKICPNMKLAIMRRHMWLLIALVIIVNISDRDWLQELMNPKYAFIYLYGSESVRQWLIIN